MSASTGITKVVLHYGKNKVELQRFSQWGLRRSIDIVENREIFVLTGIRSGIPKTLTPHTPTPFSELRALIGKPRAKKKKKKRS